MFSFGIVATAGQKYSVLKRGMDPWKIRVLWPPPISNSGLSSVASFTGIASTICVGKDMACENLTFDNLLMLVH